MKTIHLNKVAIILAIIFSLLSCSSDDGEPTATFAFSLTKQGQPYNFNHKLGIANPKMLGISLSKLSSLRTTPANLNTNPIQGCGIALNETITDDVHIGIFFTEVSLNTNLYLSNGVYKTPDYGPNPDNSKTYQLVVTEYRSGFVPLLSTTGDLTITKNNSNNSVNIKGIVTLSNGESLSFPTNGLDVPFSMCQ